MEQNNKSKKYNNNNNNNNKNLRAMEWQLLEGVDGDEYVANRRVDFVLHMNKTHP